MDTGRRARLAALLEIDDLRVAFNAAEGVVQAVNGISYTVEESEVAAIVGESGSGKSVSALAILGLVPSPPGRVSARSIRFRGQDLLSLGPAGMRAVRGRRIAMVFQEPMTSLNPVLSIGRQLTESLRLHMGLGRGAARARAVELLETAGISDPLRRLDQYPHHLSGGMRQRVMIAMALSCEPDLIIADEPTTALDVTIQAQILSLMKELTERMGAALILVTHNLGIVARYADNLHVMYAGRIVESGPASHVYRTPSHPYTVGLLNSVPRLDQPRGGRLDPIPGQPPDPSRLGPGCAFEPRCRFAETRCGVEAPRGEAVSARHYAACWRAEAVRAQAAP